MNAIDKIKARLSSHGGVRYTAGSDRIVVHPVDGNGFTVALRIAGTAVTVSFDGWHEEFETEKEALDCFAFGLSSKCRLAVVFRGKTPTRWTVEALEDGRWRQESETAMLFQPFWRRKRLEYRQNRLFDAP